VSVIRSRDVLALPDPAKAALSVTSPLVPPPDSRTRIHALMSPLPRADLICAGTHMIPLNLRTCPLAGTVLARSDLQCAVEAEYIEYGARSAPDDEIEVSAIPNT